MKSADNPSRENGGSIPRSSKPHWIAVLLFSITIAAFWQVKTHEFVGFDDDHYVTENQNVRQGLTMEGVLWAFGTTATANWHPVTWLSHMADVELFGLDPGMHHMTNLLLHIGNTILLYLLLWKMTGAAWRSAFVAACFALHPLHVESVAWIAERKDVLSTLFWMLTLWAYLRYVDLPSGTRYLPVVAFFVLGLMAKPMLVTLPFTLLLLDFWPLGRFASGPPPEAVPARPPDRHAAWRLVVEKAPLFLLTSCSAVVTWIVQARMGAMTPLHGLPPGIRLKNGVVSYAVYLMKTFWPSSLAVYYPHPGDLPLWKVAGASLLLIAISWFTIRNARRHSYIPVGWLWYLGTLVPVIGLVQVGGQAMADRYSYVPLIGVFIAVSWGIPELVARLRGPNWIPPAFGGATVAVLAVLTVLQVTHWRTTETLFEHALLVTKENALAHSNLGAEYAKRGRKEEAVRHFLEALRIDPADAVSHNNLGVILDEEGNPEQALKHFREAIRAKPRFALAHANLGETLFRLGNLPEAIDHLREAVEWNPDDPEARAHLGDALETQGDLLEASVQYREAVHLREKDVAVRLKLALLLTKLGNFEESERQYRDVLRALPENVTAWLNLGTSLLYQGRHLEAASAYRQAQTLRPDDPKTHVNLGMALAGAGNLQEAVSAYREALRLDPEEPKAHNGMGVVLAQMGNPDEAILHFRRVLRTHPNDATTHFNLAMALHLAGRTGEAVRHFRTGLRIDPENREAARQLERILGGSRSEGTE